jgi:hypothetical protein
MLKQKSIMFFLVFSLLVLLPTLVQAASITNCLLDREVYLQGESGYISVSVYNDEENIIRVTEITATINYYHVDETVYLQTFFTNATLPAEIEQGGTIMLHVPFTLPSNVAPGYREIDVRVRTEIWSNFSQRWYTSDSPHSYPVMYIESPYKQQFEDQQVTNEQLQGQLSELQAVNTTNTTIMYVLGTTTVIFVIMFVAMVMLNRRMTAIPSTR